MKKYLFFVLVASLLVINCHNQCRDKGIVELEGTELKHGRQTNDVLAERYQLARLSGKLNWEMSKEDVQNIAGLDCWGNKREAYRVEYNIKEWNYLVQAFIIVSPGPNGVIDNDLSARKLGCTKQCDDVIGQYLFIQGNFNHESSYWCKYQKIN